MPALRELKGLKLIEIPKNNFQPEIITPQGFQNRVFDSNIQLGTFSGKGHLSEKGFNYRTLSEKEMEAIKTTGGVFPKQGKAKGGNQNVKYWTKGNEKNWYASNSDGQVIRVRQDKFSRDKVVNADDVEFFNHQTGKFEPISNFKSTIGNNGMFDMTNSNIYKSVLPISLGLGAASQIEQKKEGGVIKDNDGYWNPDNWGKVVEIDSNDITMKGVNQPLLGISDEGDVQYMEPNKDYKFKRKKVREFPIARNGIINLDENSLQQLDQLTNFTNYNKLSNGGWLDKF